jgi:hypothetical protein
MPKRLRPAYVVEHKNGSKELFRTKKEICEKYGIKLSLVNHALFGFPISVDGKTSTWISHFSCKHCEDYMIESKRCFKSTLCKWSKK